MLSIATTSWPAETSHSQRCEPRKPAPPVRRTLFIDLRLNKLPDDGVHFAVIVIQCHPQVRLDPVWDCFRCRTDSSEVQHHERLKAPGSRRSTATPPTPGSIDLNMVEDFMYEHVSISDRDVRRRFAQWRFLNEVIDGKRWRSVALSLTSATPCAETRF